MMKFFRCTTLMLSLLCALECIPAQTVNIAPSKDNTLYESSSGNLSNALGSRMFAGFTDNNDIRRASLAFDIAGNIPACATVTSVSLQLNMVMTISPSFSFDLHALNADWGEGTSLASGGQGGGGSATPGDVTWVHRFFSTSNWTAPGGDFNPSASATTMIAGNGAYTWSSTPQLVADVQGWLDNPTVNYGWILRGPEGGPTTAKAFATREDANPMLRPVLTVSFTAPTGALASTSVFGAGCVGSSGVPYAFSANGVPSIGNTSFSVTVANGPANGIAQIFLATGTGASVPLTTACNFYLDLGSAVSFFNQGISPINLPLDATGSFTIPVPIGPDCGQIGLSIAGQAISADTTGIISSNALTLNLGL